MVDEVVSRFLQDSCAKGCIATRPGPNAVPRDAFQTQIKLRALFSIGSRGRRPWGSRSGQT